MPNFKATNNFNCPHCNEMLNAASGFMATDKPQDGHFTICEFCAEVCVYELTEGVIGLRKLTDEDHAYIKKHNMDEEINTFKEFVKSKPK